MKRIVYSLLRILAIALRPVCPRLYMPLMRKALRYIGVQIHGKPSYVDYNIYIDPSGGLTLSDKTVISTGVTILTHDWSFLSRLSATSIPYEELATHAYRPVRIDANSFIGAGAIILPGTTIGRNCIIGAGAVVKGKIDDFSIIAGNPGKLIGRTDK